MVVFIKFNDLRDSVRSAHYLRVLQAKQGMVMNEVVYVIMNTKGNLMSSHFFTTLAEAQAERDRIYATRKANQFKPQIQRLTKKK